jgi:hypothetical protein
MHQAQRILGARISYRKARHITSALVLACSAWAAAADSKYESNVKASSPGQIPAIQDLVEPLRKRLQKQPEDMDGWVLLGRSYEYMGKPLEASVAFGRARELGYVNPAPTSQAHSAAPLDPVFKKWMLEVTSKSAVSQSSLQ